MYFTCVFGIPHFISFYKSKPYKYLKCAYNHIKKIKDSIPFYNTRFIYILVSSSLDSDVSFSRLVEEVLLNV